MSTCIKCNSAEDLKLLNFFTFHRSYGFDESNPPPKMPIEAYKEFTRREFLKDMDKHFDDFKMEIFCSGCISNFEWDLSRVWEHYSEEGIKMTKNKNEYLEGEEKK